MARVAPRASGFSLVELLIALLLGGVVAAALVQALLGESRAAQTLGRLLRERQLGQRALELVRQELQQARWVSPQLVLPSGCGLAGRAVLLQLGSDAGVITYSQGTAPSPIWRGRVLMRCGPAYDLSGALAGGQPQNRVLLDALAAPVGARLDTSTAGLLKLHLERQLGGNQPLVQELQSAAPLALTPGMEIQATQ